MIPDRKKIIRAVDSCFDYWLEQHRHLSPLELEAVRQLKADALALLKEREAKPVKIVKNSYNYESYYCPNCDHSFYGVFKRPNYCDQCG